MAVWSKGRMRLDCCKSGDMEGLSLASFAGGASKYLFSARILRRVANVYPSRGDAPASPKPKECMMKRTLIRYTAKAELADKNAELIAAVFEELKATKPEGVRYLSLRLDDDHFVHFVETEADAANVIPGLAAFKAFQSGIRERCVEPPVFGDVTIVGNYRMLGET
jgi:hypothetical protein